jgi:DNA-binding FrmR family transcriptional regulator
MAHTVRHKKKLLNRVRRIRGQVEAIEKALLAEEDCYGVLQTISACRGAINGLMYEIVEGHVQHHVHDPRRKLTAEQGRATEELLDLIRSYLK